MDKMISKATEKNWKKLKVDSKNKLISRANKRMSTKKILPLEYISKKENIDKIEKIINIIENNNWRTEDVIFSLAVNLINYYNIQDQKNVKAFLDEYSYLNIINELNKYNISEIQENDVLGLIYQCLMAEGEKNKNGAYYTPKSVTENMTKDLDFSNSQTFLDPCCGSGAFLLALNNANPEQIYGVDTDEIAVMIAKINLIIKYKGIEFTPHIYRDNFLITDTILERKNNELDRKFTYIITNPPWGAITEKKYVPKEISSGEIFSCFIVRAFESLQENGKMRLLLPNSILNVKTHKDVRKYILENGNLSKITLYNEAFTGVTTKYIDLEVENKKSKSNVIIQNGMNIYIESKENFKLTKNIVYTIIDSKNREIIEKIKNNGRYYLGNSKWALGIVTGDNQNKLLDVQNEGYEAVYTGKEIKKYMLNSPKKFIKYDRSSFQQVAKEEYYRADEKLVYKFISNKLVFAYDDKKRLFLNSANILIPKIPNMSIKTVMAYLNSDLFNYYYKSLFGEIKILKGNLMEIPFPDITEEENIKITKMIDDVLNNNETDEKLQEEIGKTYNLNSEEIDYIKEITRQ